MKCPNCNQEVPEESKYCNNCGTEIHQNENSMADNRFQVEEPLNQAVTPSPQINEVPLMVPQSPPRRRKHVKLIILIAAIVACIVGLVLFFVFRCNHQWKDATCISPMVCSVCGKEKGEALGHEWVEATCTNPKICSRCKQTEGKALGHDYEYVVKQEPTCSKEGKKEGTCKRCSRVVVGSIEKLPHTPSGKWVTKSMGTVEDPRETQVQYCTVCGEVAETKQISLTKEQEIELYKNSCKSYTFKEISRNPDSYKGKYAYFKGEVTQVVQDETSTEYAVYRVNVTYDYYWTDAIMVVFEGSLGDGSRLIEDDIIKMYGVLDGTYTYETVFGASMTVPMFKAKYIERVN